MKRCFYCAKNIKNIIYDVDANLTGMCIQEKKRRMEPEENNPKRQKINERKLNFMYTETQVFFCSKVFFLPYC
jgi:hypothetical protein